MLKMNLFLKFHMTEPQFHIVLVCPDIPQNTGTIGRLCVNCDCRLHLIHPLGFEINDKNVQRAGLDYWPYLDLKEYESFDDFFEQNQPENFFFFTTKTERVFWDVEYPQGTYLIFGSETRGLPEELYARFADHLVTLPMTGEHARSLNLANSVSIGLFEALRQIR